MKIVGRSAPDRRQKGAVQAITCDVIAGPHDLSDIETAAVQDCLPRDKTLENTMMTQALNASHTSVNGGKETLATEPSTGKQAGRQHARIGHVGLHATNPAASARFYQDVFGVEIVGGSAPDYPFGASAFLSSRPDEESHEIALFAEPIFAHVAFKVSSLADFRSFHARVVEKNIPIKFVFNHRASFAFYFEDPDGNMVEVYWPTGDLSSRQPYVEPLDLSQPDEVLLKSLTATH